MSLGAAFLFRPLYPQKRINLVDKRAGIYLPLRVPADALQQGLLGEHLSARDRWPQGEEAPAPVIEMDENVMSHFRAFVEAQLPNQLLDQTSPRTVAHALWRLGDFLLWPELREHAQQHISRGYLWWQGGAPKRFFSCYSDLEDRVLNRNDIYAILPTPEEKNLGRRSQILRRLILKLGVEDRLKSPKLLARLLKAHGAPLLICAAPAEDDILELRLCYDKQNDLMLGDALGKWIRESPDKDQDGIEFRFSADLSKCAFRLQDGACSVEQFPSEQEASEKCRQDPNHIKLNGPWFQRFWDYGLLPRTKLRRDRWQKLMALGPQEREPDNDVFALQIDAARPSAPISARNQSILEYVPRRTGPNFNSLYDLWTRRPQEPADQLWEEFSQTGHNQEMILLMLRALDFCEAEMVNLPNEALVSSIPRSRAPFLLQSAQCVLAEGANFEAL
jgi:hypothetical protein